MLTVVFNFGATVLTVLHEVTPVRFVERRLGLGSAAMVDTFSSSLSAKTLASKPFGRVIL